MEPGGPTIVSLGASAPSITQGQTVTLTATVTDPDGADDIAGGSLTTPDRSITYGAFQLAGGTTFSIELSWDQIHSASPIEFTSEEPRSFIAEFSDMSGKKAWQAIDLTLTCNGTGACSGACTDLLSSSDHCGACGHGCAVAGHSSGCAGGQCLPGWAECFGPDDFVSCTAYCESIGSTCVQAGCEGDTRIGYNSTDSCVDWLGVAGADDAPCGDVWPPGVSAFRCCCQAR